MSIRGPLERLSRWLFWIAVVVRILPEFAQPCFPTLDGPSHLYNARILLDLTIDGEHFGRFFTTDPFPEPNMLGHVLLALLMTVLPALLAEKVLQVITALVTAWAFERLMRTIAPDQRWAPFLVLPFLIGFTTVMGFVNFNLSVPLFLLVLAESERMARRGYAALPWRAAALMLLLYLSHLSSFALASTILVGRAAWTMLWNGSALKGALLRTARNVLAAGAVPWVLTLGYVALHGDHAAAAHRFTITELSQWVLDGRAWITYGQEAELPWTRIIALTMIAMAVLAAVRYIRVPMLEREHALFWAVCALGCAVAYFILPDSMAGGTFASPRLLLFLMIMMCCWAVSTGLHVRIVGIAAVVIIAASVPHLLEQRRVARQLGLEVKELLAIAPTVPEAAVVLPLNYSDNWLHSNFSNYVGAERRAVVLDNFVATAPFSPVQWRPEALPYASVGDFDRSRSPCVRLDGYAFEGRPMIDHVLTWKLPSTAMDSCAQDVRRQLSEHFEVRARSPHGDAVLYRRR